MPFFVRPRSSNPRKRAFTSRLSLVSRYVVILTLIAGLFYTVFRSHVLSVKSVSFYFEGMGFEADQVKEAIRNEVLGRNILLLSETNVSRQVREKFLTVSAVKLTRNLPDRLSVLVSQRKPVAVVLMISEELSASVSALASTDFRGEASKAEHSLVDKDGLAFFRDKSNDLPIIVLGNHDLEVAHYLEGYDRSLINFVLPAKERDLPVYLMTRVRDDLLVILDDGTRVWLLPDKPAQVQLEILKTILEKYKIEAKKVVKVDLRFRNPVVEFK